MSFPTRVSLVSLIWVSAALATPLIAEPISSRELDVRHSGLDARQLNSKCPSAYTTKNGMSFTTYCEKNNPFNDARAPFKTDTMEECMDFCSRYWGDGEGCFGIVWREDQNCWLRNSTTGTANMKDLSGIHSALVQSDDMEPLNTECPAPDQSTHDLGNGIGYTVHCGKVIGSFDTCWEGYPSCEQSPFIGFYHATSLEDCLNFCVNEHPLCRAVSYNPGLEIGYSNCWPKTGFQQGTLNTPPSSMGILHSATITTMERPDTACPSELIYGATNNKAFEIQCGKLHLGTNITSVHSQNITSCIDACATNDKGCTGVLFDSTLQGGYSNCYLQNTTSVISDQAQTTYAALTDKTPPSSTPNPADPNSSSSSSKAWIAGPVIGGVAALVLIGLAIFWLRRRKAKAAAPGAYAGVPVEKDGTPAVPQYTSYDPTTGRYAPVYPASPSVPPSELGGDYAREMLARVPTTKYAHKHDRRSAAPQELPT